MVRFIIHDWERLEYKQLVTDVGFSVERSNHDQIFIKTSQMFSSSYILTFDSGLVTYIIILFALQLLLHYFFVFFACFDFSLLHELILLELSMKMVSGKIKPHRGIWLS